MHDDQATAAVSDDAFWADDEYDREHASDGVSRYGAYVHQAATTFAEC